MWIFNGIYMCDHENILKLCWLNQGILIIYYISYYKLIRICSLYIVFINIVYWVRTTIKLFGILNCIQLIRVVVAIFTIYGCWVRTYQWIHWYVAIQSVKLVYEIFWYFINIVYRSGHYDQTLKWSGLYCSYLYNI
jgi:hypothetical protein